MKMKVLTPFYDDYGIHKIGEIIERKALIEGLTEEIKETEKKEEKAAPKTTKKTTAKKKG